MTDTAEDGAITQDERQAIIHQSLPTIADALSSVNYNVATITQQAGGIVLLEVTRRQRFEPDEPRS